jgi:TPR repeat protein
MEARSLAQMKTDEIMKWFYLSENNEVIGPASETALKQLKACGVIKSETRICREGTEDWITSDEMPDSAMTPADMTELFKFNCPHCSQHIEAAKEDAGKQAECTTCGLALLVPTFAEEKMDDHMEGRFSVGQEKPKPRRRFTILIVGSSLLVLTVTGIIKAQRSPSPILAQRSSSTKDTAPSVSAKNAMIQQLLEWPDAIECRHDQEAPDEILAAIQPLATKGDTKAQFVSLVINHEQKKITEEKKWLSKLTSLASGGNAEAQHYLYFYYRDRKKDDKESIKWLTRSLIQDFLPAQVAYGQALLEGRGVRKDSFEGFKLIKKAAESGEPRALASLAFCYIKKEGTSMDNVTDRIGLAIKLLTEASDKGYPFAAKVLYRIYSPYWGHPYDYPVAKNSEKALLWLHRAIENEPYHEDHPKTLGDFYAKGWLVSKDEAKAVYWWKKAAENGDYRMAFLVGLCYKNGFGVAKNREISADWIRRAIDHGVLEIERDEVKMVEVTSIMPDHHYKQINKEFVRDFRSRLRRISSEKSYLLPIERLIGAFDRIGLSAISPELAQAAREVTCIKTGYTDSEVARRIERFLALCEKYE